MRQLTVVLLVAFFATWRGFSGQIRVTTWKLSFPPNNSRSASPTETEERPLREAAATLKSLDPDVVLLQDVRDARSCNRLAKLLRPAQYYVLVCSAFPSAPSGGVSRGQVAILSKRAAFGAWAESWKKEGTVEPPGGFAFAAIRFDGVDVGFYSVQMRDNQTRGNVEREAQLNILKRELSARQLVRHVAAVDGKITNPERAFVLGGDFNTNPDQDLFVTESTLQSLKDAGFTNLFQNIPSPRRITRPGNGRFPDATFDYLLARNASFDGPYRIASTRVSDRLPITSTLILPAAQPATARVSLPVAGRTLPEFARDKKLWVAGGGAIILVIVAVFRRAWRRRASHPQFAVAGFTDAYSSRAARREFCDRRPETAAALRPKVSVPGEAADGQSAFWKKRALEAENRAERTTAIVKAGLVPHLARMLKDKLFWKLVSQRSRLLQDQQASGKMLAEFEQRLAAVQSQFQSRIRTYEQRIDELRREVAIRERELLRMRAGADAAREPVTAHAPGSFES